LTGVSEQKRLETPAPWRYLHIQLRSATCTSHWPDAQRVESVGALLTAPDEMRLATALSRQASATEVVQLHVISVPAV